MLDWDKLFRRYVWDDDKTPYFTAVPRLTRRQADYEIRFFAIFLGILFSVVALAASTDAGPAGRSAGIALYALSVVCASVVLAFTKHYWSALYCGAAPIASLAYFLLYQPNEKLGAIDYVVISAILALWARYSLRVAAIGRRYPSMPGPAGGDGP